MLRAASSRRSLLRPPLLLLLLLLLFLAGPVLANVEKAIFLGPPTIRVAPHEHPTLSDLRLDVLTPDEGRSSLRTQVRAEFPTTDGGGRERATWLLLDGLTPSQRYEVRICWAATQPTDFRLRVHEVPVVWDSPDLISSLAAYSTSRIEEEEEEARSASSSSGSDGDGALWRRSRPGATGADSKSGEHEASVLLLQITAAADYFSTNQTLMRNVPPVHVDIILDPYLLGVLPRSLLPTVCYIAVVAACAALFAPHAAAWLQRLATSDHPSPDSLKKWQ